MSKLRDRILQADDIGSEIVEIPAWNVKVEVRSLTAGEQMELLKKCRKPDGELNNDSLPIETLLTVCYDPETGEKLFDPADRDALRNKSASAYGLLLQAANRAAGFTTESEVVSGLDETPTDVSSST